MNIVGARRKPLRPRDGGIYVPQLAWSEPIPTAAEVRIQFLRNQPKADRLTHPRKQETPIAVTRTWAHVFQVARRRSSRRAGKRFFIVINESG